MIADRAKRRAAGRVKWAINKLLSHADMAVKVPEAALSQVLPSAQQCCRLAEGLGAALIELEREPDERKTAFHAAPGSGALKWSAEKPKRRGWWWVETLLDRRIVHVWESRSGLKVNYGGSHEADSIDDDYYKRWAGPLVEPQEAPDAEPLPNRQAVRIGGAGRRRDWRTTVSAPTIRTSAWLAVASYRRARAEEKDRWGVGGVRSQLWQQDIRNFGITVQRESPKRLTLMEPLSCTAPSFARPYCCYMNTVIFYVWPYVVVKPRTGPWKDTSPGSFLEWERLDTVLSWNERIMFEGAQYEVAGGRVIRHGKAWWMKRDARLHEVRWAAGAGVCDGNGESQSAPQTANVKVSDRHE